MTVPTDPAGGGGSPRSAERLSSAFRYTGDPLFVLHGPGVLDALVCRDYLERDFEAALWEELSAAGFERIVFWTPWEKGLYFRDADSSAGRPRGTGSPLGTGSPRGIGASETANAAGPVPPPAAPGGPAGGTMRFFNGPMGAVNRLGAGRLGPGRPSGPGGPGAGAAVGTGRPPAASTVGSMTDGAAVRLLATWLSPRGPRNPLRTAAVFLSTPELLTHLRPEAVRPLAGLFGELTGGPRTDHLCVLISGESDRSRIIAEVRRTGLFTTLADWLEGTAADGCYGYVGHAPPAEIERAIHRTRLVDGLDIGDWAGLPRLAAAMSAESNATRKWLSTMQLWARERRPLDGPELAKAGHLTGGSPDGRSAWERLDAMTGLGTVKEHVRRLAGATRLLAARPAGSGRRAQAGSHHLVFTGGPGTGKTTVARLIGEIYRDLGILARGHVRAPEVSQLVAGYEGQTAIAVNREADEALDGVLFIDEAYRLTERRDSPFGQEAVNALLSRMENDRERLVVIVAGYQGEMKRFLDANPGLRGRFPEANIIHFPDYEPDELTDILLRNLADIGLTWEPDTEEALRTVVAGIHRLRDERFSNAREMRSLADDLQANWSSRVQRAAGAVDLGKRPAGDDGRAAAWAAEQETAAPGDLAALWERPLLRADIPGRYAMHLPGQAPPIDEVLAGLAELIGLGQVKAHIRELAGTMQLLAARPAGSGRRAPAGSHHLVFTGGPGTGKTTVARLIGEIYRAIGVLRRGHVRAPEVSQLVAGYEGQTAIAVNREADEALDGVLFIDEAYRLTERRDSPFGQEAVNALLSRMENDRERLVVIVAGYQEHMRRFLDANPGLRGRFPEANIIHFPDYEPDELTTILLRQLTAGGLTWEPETEQALRAVVAGMYRRRGEDFSNARAMRSLADELRARWSGRVLADGGPGGDPARLAALWERPLLPADIPERLQRDLPGRVPPIEQVLAALDALVGMGPVRASLEALQRRLRHRQRIGAPGVVAPHLLFLGPPGTGKTTVARLVGEMFAALGLLSKGHVVEVKREDLVAGYLGQTEQKTSDAIAKAIGGVLFIDEAYALARGGPQDFGREAINTLVPAMENLRGRLVVIAAGYPGSMREFLAVNEGLPSRFGETIEFPDYEPNDLVEILERMAGAAGYRLDPAARPAAADWFRRRRDADGPAFANARTARGLLDRMEDRLTARMAQRPDADQAELTTLTEADLPA